MKRYRLVIFDMDDTLVSSSSTWINAETKLYEYIGRAYSSEAASGYKGMNAMDVGKSIHRYFHPENLTEDDCGEMLREWLLEEFRGPIHSMPGADDLLGRLSGRIDMVVASGSPVEGIREALEGLGWTRYFRDVISSEEVVRGKPEPDVFLEAARRMGCMPGEALVIEDSLHGLRAAKKAGMDCFVIPRTDDIHIAAEADSTYPRLDCVPSEDILGR